VATEIESKQNMQETNRPKASTTMTTQTAPLCLRCGFHPASPRREGYCSWDCHEADEDEDGDQVDEGGGERVA
jgi:hypothetical protein